MNLRSLACAAAIALCSSSALAVETPFYQVPYLGGDLAGMHPDSVRNADVVGGGYHAFGGWPLKSGHTAVEVRLLDYQMKRRIDGKQNFTTSLYTDYVYDFGSSIEGGSGFFHGTKFFVNAGLGLVREDNYGNKGSYVGVDAGGGMLVPLGFKGWAVRLDARAQYENNGDLCDSAAVSAGKCKEQRSYLLDYTFGAGLQIPLTIFFDKPKEVAQRDDCPIAVVDPATGRRDCGGHAADADSDGIADADDRCPSTANGFRVDAQGCALAQGFDFSAATLFAGNTATLTLEGKHQLAEVGRMLAAQPGAVATVLVPAPAAGASEAFDLMLGEQRSAAVAQELLNDGVKPEQLSDDATAAQARGAVLLTLAVRP